MTDRPAPHRHADDGSDPDDSEMEILSDGIIVCKRPGAGPLTADEREALSEFAQFLRERKQITEQYEGAERTVKLAEHARAFTVAYDAKHRTDGSEP